MSKSALSRLCDMFGSDRDQGCCLARRYETAIAMPSVQTQSYSRSAVTGKPQPICCLSLTTQGKHAPALGKPPALGDPSPWRPAFIQWRSHGEQGSRNLPSDARSTMKWKPSLTWFRDIILGKQYVNICTVSSQAAERLLWCNLTLFQVYHMDSFLYKLQPVDLYLQYKTQGKDAVT